MTDIVERLREWSTCNVFPEQAQYAVSAACLDITSLRAEVVSKNEQFQEYARRMESDMNALAAQNERLRGVLAWFADEYDQMNFMRSADMHRAECRCLRCARDEARAALGEKQ